MLVGENLERCPRCGQTFPRTLEHFYFSRGKITGYCRNGCQADWWRSYRAGLSPERHERLVVATREASRNWHRRQHGVTPDRFRPAAYAENRR